MVKQQKGYLLFTVLDILIFGICALPRIMEALGVVERVGSAFHFVIFVYVLPVYILLRGLTVCTLFAFVFALLSTVASLLTRFVKKASGRS